MFGTDRYPGRLDEPRNAIYYRFLESEDEYFKPYDHPFAPSGDWMTGVFSGRNVAENLCGKRRSALSGKPPVK